MELTIVRSGRRPIDGISAEMRFLDAILAEQASRVFERVRWSDRPWDGPGYVLRIEGNCLVGERSLRAMRALGAETVTATPFQPGQEEIYTLSDYERAEERVLAQHESSTASPGPVTLFAPGAERKGLGRVPTGGIFLQFADYYGSAREDVLPYIPADTRTVLEVGCGKGKTAALLKERLGCRVTGVELNAQACRDAARAMERVFQGDFLELDLKGRWDLLLATDVFEHNLESATFLKKARRLARRTLLSVPNVGHHAIVRGLLEGRWDYVPMGILCYSHLRFFTRSSLATLLRQAGFERYSIHPQTGELPAWVDELPAGLALDRENLASRGFYVLIDNE